MFEKLYGVTDESQIQLDQFLDDEITEHLQSLEKEFERYFPELSQEILIRNPFCTELDVSTIPYDIQDEFPHPHPRTTKQLTRTYNTAYSTSRTYHTQSSPEM